VTKVMISGVVMANGKWPCAVCKKGVERNSIMCDGWVHKRCSGVYGRLQDVIGFECTTCRGNHMIEARMEKIDVGGGILKCVDKFCYLGDKLGAGVGVEASSIMRVA